MYANLKVVFDKLNLDETHFLNSNDICTPMDCVEEMIDRVPQEFWTRKNVDVLDPCAGNGNFPLYIEEKFRRNDNDSFTLCANEINIKRVENLKKYFSDIVVTIEDFFSFTEERKYDLIVANPPYAKIDINGVRAAKNHNLSRDFIRKATSLLKKNGYMVFIVPDNWMSLSDRNDIVEQLSEYQFIHLNIHKAKRYFRGIGSSFTWFVLHKVENTKPFLVENSFVKMEDSIVCLEKGVRNIPLFYNSLVLSIVDKTLNANNEKMGIETTSDLHRYTKKDLLSIDKDKIYKYKVIHTQNQVVWSSRPHKYQDGWKVFISVTSYYSTFIDDCGMTQSIAFVRCKDKEEAEDLQKILNHPLYKFLNNIHRYGNFNNIRILQKFPYTSNDVWKSFNITDEEKQFVIDFLN